LATPHQALRGRGGPYRAVWRLSTQAGGPPADPSTAAKMA